MTAWFVDLKEEDLFLDDVIEACFENFFDPTFTKKFVRPDLVLVRRLAGQVRLKMSLYMIHSLSVLWHRFFRLVDLFYPSLASPSLRIKSLVLMALSIGAKSIGKYQMKWIE